MTAYLTRRLATLPLLLLGISAVAFTLLNIAPGEPAENALRRRNPGATPNPAAIAQMRAELGLDAPMPTRYIRWLTSALRGDLGESYLSEQDVAGQLARSTAPTATLAASALVMAISAALPLGVISALRRGGLIDSLGRLTALVGASVPSYALAYGLIILFAVKLSWLPALGYGDAAQLALPALALSLAPMAQLTRLVRASMLETLAQDYIVTARGKGLANSVIASRHALRNALLPAISALGVSVGNLLGGAVIIETIFGWPGLGQLIVTAATTRDYPIVQGFALYVAAITMLVNLFADILLRIADPRIRFARTDA